ncbi:MAG: hypothetical protein K2J71_09050 [Oscillospiraceae bacterium]|nr:hypothetical protein [Oscillospiraceae bacterium]
MADNMKNIGVPIKDDDLDGVVGGVNILPLTNEEREQIINALSSGEFGAPQNQNTINNLSERFRLPACSPGTVEPLDNAATRIAEEFRQGMNLGGLPK